MYTSLNKTTSSQVKSTAIGSAPCPNCRMNGEDTKGDNLILFDDNHSHCFACGYHKNNHLTSAEEDGKIWLYDKEIERKETVVSDTYINYRGNTADTSRFYGVSSNVNDQGEPVTRNYPYGSYRCKHRNTKDKSFFFSGPKENMLPLFGMDRFTAGEAKAITVTEGEEDALAAFQMLGSKYPCVSVQSAGIEINEQAYEYLNSFEKIYICFDGDKPGKAGAQKLAAMFDPNKVFVVELTKFKDPLEYQEKGEQKQFVHVWWNAKKYVPKGLLATYEEVYNVFEKVDQKPIASYPFSKLEEMTFGIRSGELILFSAQQKIGKTEIFRAIEHHLLKTTNERLALIHLEDTDKRTLQGIVTYESGIPCHLPAHALSPDEMLKYYKEATGNDESRVHVYSHFGSDDPNTILGVIRYLVKVCGCKFVFLDHITMLATGFENDDERRKLDFISTRLAMLVKELDFTLFVISHVNDEGLPRGSRNIGKVCDIHIQLHRDKMAPTMIERNTTTLSIVDNRFCGFTGSSDVLLFNPETFKLEEKIILDDPNDIASKV